MNAPVPNHNRDALPTLEELITDESLRELWADYIDGGWVPGSPADPGIYQVATAEGDYVGLKEFVLRNGTIVDKYRGHAEPEWQGYVWSRPLPPPPAFVDEGV